MKDEYLEDPELIIVPREKWGALPPKFTEPLPLPAQRLMFLCTNTERCMNKQECMKAMRTLQKYYMEVKGMPDIPYSFVIGGDLRVYEGRGWGVMIRRRDCQDWVDERVVFGFCHHETVNDKRIMKMLLKGYDLLDYAIHKEYLVNFNEYEYQDEEARANEEKEYEQQAYKKAEKECEKEIKREEKKAEKWQKDKKKWEKDINEIHFESARAPTFQGDKDKLEEIMEENKEELDRLKITEQNWKDHVDSSSLDSSSFIDSEEESAPI